MFVASTLIGFTLMEAYPAMKSSSPTARLPGCRRCSKRWRPDPRYPTVAPLSGSTEPEELWEHGNVMLGSTPRSG